ncbi:CMGC/CDKL protein kinase, variant 2 [Aphanomyces invadans]|uniref:Cyclin-dependent kinase 2 homolog n=1 Tax=Aphanomyces invadans TaxID=157072 RepID=A0A024U2G5_9STRA|nr:CMGC/CDKL protein kinase, variant 2 [Aphanomyces invadans]ETW00409.1 CMGC/CDKL protein kinase, variant 2 [Aphanomyces invadans]|eukprot:XP_008870544.1 CMGC/CDKL protein kinase, variant 2 [Aphanomyces invadans]
MENYENLGTIGEGTYGVVLKCRHKETGQIVAIKKFKESDEDEQVKKTAMREIRILKQLKHENIVNLIEVFRRKGKLYLVFEYVEKTILEEIEKNPEGLDPAVIRSLMWQLVRAIQFCHQNNIIHRDIKPENLLVSKNGVLKLCDFGFARTLAAAGAKYTDYVSTRWYRAPELLVGDVSYGKAVDIWAVGCMFAEITTGLPLFPGDSDIDQLYHIIKCLGRITSRQQELFRKNSLYVGVKLPEVTEVESLEDRFPQLDKVSIDFLKQTVQDEPLDRWTCAELLKHPLIAEGAQEYDEQLRESIAKDIVDNMVKPVPGRRPKKPPPTPSQAASRPPAQPQLMPAKPPPSIGTPPNDHATTTTSPSTKQTPPHGGIAMNHTTKTSKLAHVKADPYSTTMAPDTPKKQPHHHHGTQNSRVTWPLGLMRRSCR